jgi:hypothetical protein
MVLKVMEAYFNGGKPLPPKVDKDGIKPAAPTGRRTRRSR